MNEFSLYRRRIIPAECILLKDDEILSFDEGRIVTRWRALRPKKDLHHGISCYFLSNGCKVSKFYQADGTLLYWYVDIIDFSWEENVTLYDRGQLPADGCSDFKQSTRVYNAEHSDIESYHARLAPSSIHTETDRVVTPHLLVTDLLADVIIYPDGSYRIVDLAELADALSDDLFHPTMLTDALRKLDAFLAAFYDGRFEEMKAYIEKFEKN
jgi:predicted RNA-binding protein associated with RNAse of E/G family